MRVDPQRKDFRISEKQLLCSSTFHSFNLLTLQRHDATRCSSDKLCAVIPKPSHMVLPLPPVFKTSISGVHRCDEFHHFTDAWKLFF